MNEEIDDVEVESDAGEDVVFWLHVSHQLTKIKDQVSAGDQRSV